MNNRIIRVIAALLAFAAVLHPAGACPAGAAEAAAARAERFNGLVESMDATSSRRAGTVELIYNELKGAYGREMQEMLRLSLRRPNTLIVQGAVEALALNGDAGDVPSLEALLATSGMLEVKTLTLRLLPAFCLLSERDRFRYIRYAAGYEPIATEAVLAPLRRPPLTRRGRLNPELDRLRLNVASCVVGQFDPVAAALAYIDDPLVAQAARSTVTHYVGRALGNDPVRWREIWSSGTGGGFLVPDEIEEIRLAALQALSDMGAEGMPNILAAFEKLSRDTGVILSQAAFDAMASMCRTAFSESDALSRLTFDKEDAVAGGNWAARRRESAINFASFAATRARAAMTPTADSARFGAAATCLAAALAYPPGISDPDGRLAEARREGMASLELLLIMPEMGWERRAAVVKAMGLLGEERGAAAIAGIIASPYVSPEAEAGGLRLAEACVESLVTMATGENAGRDEARRLILSLLSDDREYPPARPGSPPVKMGHLALWRLQRLAKATETSLDPELWRARLGW